MSLLTKASLIATPTAYGDGVLNSVKPTNGDGDFDFARASAATRVNEQGLIEKERGNLLLQSNQFDTTWNNVNVTLTSGQAGYDGTNNAWKLVGSTSNVSHYVNQVFSVSGVVTLSVYVKPSGYNYMLLYAGSYGGTFFDIANGTIGNNIPTTPIDANIESAGNGWYRVSISVNNGVDIGIFPSPDGTSYAYSGDGTSGILIQDAQLEQGLVATDYIETTTTAVYEGITNDIPRINYENGIGSFLLEPQRTNLVPYSEYFGASNWTKTNVTITDNAATSPEGVDNAVQITGDGTSGQHYVLQSANYTSGTTYTCSIFAKADTHNYIQLIIGAAPFGSTNYCNFDLSDGSIGTTGSAISDEFIEDYGDGWYRIGFSATAVSTGSGNFFPTLVTSDSAPFLESNSTTGSVFLYGAQVEAGSYATSYIPTYGTSVTRVAETCNNAGDSSLFNDSEGVLYAEIAALANDGTNRFLTINGGSYLNRVAIIYTSTSNQIQVRTTIGGSDVYSKFETVNDTTAFNKVLIKYKNNDFSFWINGFEYQPQLSGSTFSSGTIIKASFDSGSGSPFYGKTKMVATFTEALSDSELECLTSWSSFNRMATAQNYTIQ